MYDEIIDDPKILGLLPEERWFFVGLLAVSSRQITRGTIPDPKVLAIHLRIRPSRAAKLLERFAAAGLVDRDGTRFAIHGWGSRQFKSDDVTQRWRKHISNVGTKAGTNVGQTSPPACVIPETETETERERENPPPLFSRSGEDADQFAQAVSLLSGSLQTEGVALELRRRAELPEIRTIEGWRWLNAARVMGKGAKAYTIDFLLGIARQTTREEFESYGKAPANGQHKGRDDPPTNQPVSAMNPPPDIEEWNRKAAADPEYQKTLEIIRSKRAGSKVPPLRDL